MKFILPAMFAMMFGAAPALGAVGESVLRGESSAKRQEDCDA